MSDAPFRELFVELPATVFEMLQGIGEAAVRQAQPQPRFTPAGQLGALVEFVRGRAMRDTIAKHFGWRRMTIERLAHRQQIDVIAVLDCGHRSRGTIDEDALFEYQPRAFVDYLIARLEDVDLHGRRCYCVRRSERGCWCPRCGKPAESSATILGGMKVVGCPCVGDRAWLAPTTL